MARFLSGIVVIALAAFCFTRDCTAFPSDTYPVAVFSDVHFNPFYDEALFQSLLTSDAGAWAGIFAGSQIKEPSAWGDDTNYPLLVLALSGMRQNLGATPAVIFTGDVLGHEFPQKFYQLYGRKDRAAMEAFADKTVSFFTQLVKTYAEGIPVMFVLGNSDSYTGFGPDRKFLSNTADIFYSNWIGAAADQQEFLGTYKAGGYYAAELPGTNVLVIALNTFNLSTLAFGSRACAVQAELAWLEARLASARSAGQAVWLLMHVPPGMYLEETADKLTPRGRLFSASKMLKPRYQARLVRILSDYSDVITMMLAGHTHMDEFRNIFGGDPLQAQGFLQITPGITPCFNNNPAFKVFTMSKSGNAPVDYKTLNCDLAAKPAQFEPQYDFSTAYFGGPASGVLNDALAELYPELAADQARQDLFRTYYYSGNDSSNTITDANWKVYWLGIANMTAPALIRCVNSY